LGAIGVVLPGWPTTDLDHPGHVLLRPLQPALLQLADEPPVFGPLIRDWRDGKGMTARAKTLAVTSIVLSIGISILLIPYVWVKVLLVVIAIDSVHLPADGCRRSRPATEPGVGAAPQ
jgi:uncharacterized protein